jgi:hypothetical protein
MEERTNHTISYKRPSIYSRTINNSTTNLKPQTSNFKPQTSALILPIKCALLYYINESTQEKRYKHQHGQESTPSKRTEINSVRIKEDYFYIKQNEKNSNKKNI